MWGVETTDTSGAWFELQNRALKKDMLATMFILPEFSPRFGCPYVNAVKDPTFQNVKELRVQHHGFPIRVFFVFDLLREAIALCAGSKDGMSEKRFYKEMTALADREFGQYLTKER